MNASDLVAELAAFALSLPEAWRDTPWGESVVKVRKKIFLFHSSPGSDLLTGRANSRAIITVKVPESRDHALSLPESAPTGYGLGKAGWVTIPVDRMPSALLAEQSEALFDFVEESYRVVAPKTLVKQLDSTTQ